MKRCLNCNVPCRGDFCCDGCEREYGVIESVDWDKLEAEVKAEIAQDAARRVS